MSQDLINKVLFITHDKWDSSYITQEEKDKHKLDREDFEEFLKMFIDKEPLVIKDLQTIVEYGNDEQKHFIIRKSVLSLLREAYPSTHKSVIRRQFSSRAKMGRFDYKEKKNDK